MRFVIISILSIILSGCYNEAQKLQANNNTIKSGGILVATFPDGQELRRYDIIVGAGGETHAIYVVGNVTTVNSRRGKMSATEVIINNVPYFPAEEPQ